MKKFQFIKLAFITFIMLSSTLTHAEWLDFACYHSKSATPGSETDKFYSYNDSIQKAKLDKKETSVYSATFRGNNIHFQRPSGKNKIDVDFDKSNGHLTLTMVGGLFNGRKYLAYCYKE